MLLQMLLLSIKTSIYIFFPHVNLLVSIYHNITDIAAQFCLRLVQSKCCVGDPTSFYCNLFCTWKPQLDRYVHTFELSSIPHNLNCVILDNVIYSATWLKLQLRNIASFMILCTIMLYSSCIGAVIRWAEIRCQHAWQEGYGMVFRHIPIC